MITESTDKEQTDNMFFPKSFERFVLVAVNASKLRWRILIYKHANLPWHMGLDWLNIVVRLSQWTLISGRKTKPRTYAADPFPEELPHSSLSLFFEVEATIKPIKGLRSGSRKKGEWRGSLCNDDDGWSKKRVATTYALKKKKKKRKVTPWWTGDLGVELGSTYLRLASTKGIWNDELRYLANISENILLTV